MVKPKIKKLEPQAFLEVGHFSKVIPAQIQGFNSRKQLQGLIHKDHSIAWACCRCQSAPHLCILYLNCPLNKNMTQNTLQNFKGYQLVPLCRVLRKSKLTNTISPQHLHESDVGPAKTIKN